MTSNPFSDLWETNTVVGRIFYVRCSRAKEMEAAVLAALLLLACILTGYAQEMTT